MNNVDILAINKPRASSEVETIDYITVLLCNKVCSVIIHAFQADMIVIGYIESYEVVP